MRQIDSTYFKMFKLVKNTMAKNKPIWLLNQLIVDCVDLLNTNIDLITTASGELLDKPSYITIAKKDTRISINKQTFIIKEGLRLYYSMNGMTEDMQMFTYPVTKLIRMPDGDLYLEASHIVERAEKLSAQLIPIGITPEKTAKLKANLITFYNIPPIRKYKAKKLAINVKLIPKLVKETAFMLRNSLDALVAMYDEETNKQFVATYKNVRKRNAKPGRHKYYTLLVKGTVKDAETNDVLSEVTIEAGAKKKIVITDTEGYYNVRIYIKDADVITFTKEGYESLTIDIPKKYKDHEVEVNASLKRLLVD